MSVVPYSLPSDPGSRQWVELMQPAIELAKAVAGTDFVPKAMRNNPAQITAAILYGDEVGLGPMQSLARISVIDGRPSLAAEAQRALILAAGHELWIEESTITRCTVAGRRRDSDQTSRVTWTSDDAKRAELDGKPNWRSYPRQMLLARASAELARAVFADAIGGLAATEELDEATRPTARGRAFTTPTGRNASPRRRPRVAAGPAPPRRRPSSAPPAPTEPELPPLPGEQDEPEPAKPSEPALRKMFVLFGRARDARPRHPPRVGQPAPRPRTRDRRAAHRHRNLAADRRACRPPSTRPRNRPVTRDDVGADRRPPARPSENRRGLADRSSIRRARTTCAVALRGVPDRRCHRPAVRVAHGSKSAARRRRAVNALVETGLWVPNGDGWLIHDYLDYNEPRELLLERRRAREAKRRGNRGRLDANR